MADETIKIQGEMGSAVSGLNETAQGLENVDQAQKNQASSAKDSSSSAADLAGKMAVLAAAAAAVNATLIEGVNLWAEQDAANGQLARSFRKAGAGAGELNKAMKDIKFLSREVGVNQLEATEAMRTLVDTTKDATTATDDFRLANDINSQTNLGVAASAKLLAKVRNGNITQLEKLGVLTKDQVRDLNKLEDENKKVEIAMAGLRDQFAGATDENAGFADQMSATGENLDAVKKAAGGVVAAMMVEGGGMLGSFLDLITFSEQGTFTLKNFAVGVEGFADAIREAASAVDSLLVGLQNLDFDELDFEGAAAGAATGFFSPVPGGALAGATAGFLADNANTAISKGDTIKARQRQNAPEGPTLSAQKNDGPSAVERLKLAKEEAEAAKEAAKADKSRTKSAKARQKSAEREQAAKERQAEIEKEQAEREAEAARQLADQVKIEEMKLELMRETDEIQRVVLDNEIRIAEIKAAGLEPEIEKLRILQAQEQASAKMTATVNALNEKQKTSGKEGEKATKKQAKGQESVLDAMEKTSTGIDLVNQTFLGAKSVEAGKEAALEGARAIAAAASGNFLGAAGHAAAAVQFGKEAIGSIAGGGASASSKSKPSVKPPPDPKEVAREQGRIIAEEMQRGLGGGPGSIELNVNFNSLVPEPEQANRALEVLRRAESRRV